MEGLSECSLHVGLVFPLQPSECISVEHGEYDEEATASNRRKKTNNSFHVAGKCQKGRRQQKPTSSEKVTANIVCRDSPSETTETNSNSQQTGT